MQITLLITMLGLPQESQTDLRYRGIPIERGGSLGPGHIMMFGEVLPDFMARIAKGHQTARRLA